MHKSGSDEVFIEYQCKCMEEEAWEMWMKYW